MLLSIGRDISSIGGNPSRLLDTLARRPTLPLLSRCLTLYIHSRTRDTAFGGSIFQYGALLKCISPGLEMSEITPWSSTVENGEFRSPESPHFRGSFWDPLEGSERSPMTSQLCPGATHVKLGSQWNWGPLSSRL